MERNTYTLCAYYRNYNGDRVHLNACAQLRHQKCYTPIGAITRSTILLYVVNNNGSTRVAVVFLVGKLLQFLLEIT